MLTITEPKIAGFAPRWAPFPGFSFLFDNPSSAYRLDEGLEHLSCDIEADPQLEFYRQARRALESLNLDRMLQTYLFCALPPESYHVTAFDVANQGDLTRCKGEALDSLRELLAMPVDHGCFSHPILQDARSSVLAGRRWQVSFRFQAVRIWGRVMVLELAPFGPEDAAKLAELVETRRGLHLGYREKYAFGAGPKLTPHLSLGYFGNAEGTELAAARLPVWNEVISSSVRDLPLTFESVSLHGFSTMADFFRLPRP